MKILITGGAGTLGSNIIEQLLDQDSVEIICIDNFETGSRENISFFPEEQIIEGSVANFDFLENIFRKFKPDVVIHSAASYKDPDNYQQDAHTNIIGSINVGRLSKLNDVSKVINFQTALCYGIPKKVPISIEHELSPFTSYGISKAHGEYYLSQMKIPLVSLRLANICSKNLSIGPIPTFYSRIKQGKSCYCSDTVRDFLDFDDFFELLKIILFNSNKLGKFNVSSGVGKSITNVFDEVKKVMGANNAIAELRSISNDDNPELVLDPTLTQETFGWKAKISFEKIIERQINFYEIEGVKNIFSHLKQKNG